MTAVAGKDVLGVDAGELLRTYAQTSIQQMGRQRGLQVTGKSKAALIPPIAKTLYDPGRIERALTELEPSERAALDTLVLLGGQATTAVVRRLLEERDVVEHSAPPRAGGPRARGSPARAGSRLFEDVIARLGALGLVFTADLSAYNRTVELADPAHILFIPEPILQHLPRVELPVDTTSPPAIVRDGDVSLLLRDAYTMLSKARERPLPLIARNLIGKRTLVELDDAFRVHEGARQARAETDLGRLSFLRAVLEGLGLLVPGVGVLQLGPQAGTFLSLSSGLRQRQLYLAYRDSTRWSELTRLHGISVRPRDNATGPLVTAARRRVLQEIAILPFGAWVPLAHLVERLRRTAYEFLLPRRQVFDHAYYGWSAYTEPHPYGGENPLGLTFDDIIDESSGWRQVEAAFIRAVVTEPLFWLGMVDLGMTEEGAAPSVFRVNDAGAALFRGAVPASAAAEPHVVVQPNFQIFAFEPTGEDVLFTLDRLAKRVRAEQAVEYHVTRESVYAAQRDGMDTADILAFLDRISATPIPQNVRRSIEEWGAQMERIVVRRGTGLVETLDESTLDQLYADAELGRLLGRRLGPTAALAPVERLQPIYARLLARAPELPLPALSEGTDSQSVPAIKLDAEGRVTFTAPLPSMYIRHVLRGFADEGPDGALQITPAGLRRGARGGATAETIMETLKRFHVGPIPDEIAALVDRYTKRWGRASLQDVHLLEVEQAETMNNLTADEEIGRFLKPIPGAARVAIVERRHADRLRELLEDRGVQLE